MKKTTPNMNKIKKTSTSSLLPVCIDPDGYKELVKKLGMQ